MLRSAPCREVDGKAVTGAASPGGRRLAEVAGVGRVEARSGLRSGSGSRQGPHFQTRWHAAGDATAGCHWASGGLLAARRSPQPHHAWRCVAAWRGHQLSRCGAARQQTQRGGLRGLRPAGLEFRTTRSSGSRHKARRVSRGATSPPLRGQGHLVGIASRFMVCRAAVCTPTRRPRQPWRAPTHDVQAQQDRAGPSQAAGASPPIATPRSARPRAAGSHDQVMRVSVTPECEFGCMRACTGSLVQPQRAGRGGRRGSVRAPTAPLTVPG